MLLNKNFLKRVQIKHTETIQRRQEDWKEWSKERLWKTAEVILGESRKGRKEQTMILRVEVETSWWRHAPETPQTVWTLDLGCLWSNLKSFHLLLDCPVISTFPKKYSWEPMCMYFCNKLWVLEPSWGKFLHLAATKQPKLTRGHIC